jgi:hypothetical protein
VSSSGLIYAAIVALWAAYLVPMWLRRQDELAESGAQDRLFTAMRVLARRPTAENPAETPAEASHHLGLESGTDPRERRRQRRSEARARRASVAAGRPSRRRRVVLARRRRVISALFLTFTAGSALTAAYGQLWVAVPATSGLLLSLYIVYLRAQERRRAEVRRRTRRAETTLRRHRGTEPAGGVPASRRRTVGGGGRGADGWDDEPGEGDTWDPVPVPLPTYVTAPVAPGAQMWTYTPPAASADAGFPAEDRRPAVYDQYSDLEDRPRAVND